MLDTGGMVICRPAHILDGPPTVTLMSDLHVGAAHVNYKLIQSELETADAYDDRIALNGDLVDMILPGDRKRFRCDVLHKRLRGTNDVIGKQIEWAVELLTPYAHRIDMIGVGNHEDAVSKYHNLDPTALIVRELQRSLPAKHKDHVIHYGGYTGYLVYTFPRMASEVDNKQAGTRLVIWYHHGGGGGAPVTKGMIDLHRTQWVEADVIWLGHKHTRITAHVQAMRCPLRGKQPILRDVRQVITGGYFHTYRSQAQDQIRQHGRRANYAADSAMAPQGQGGARLVVSVEQSGNRYYPGVKVIQ